MATHTCCGCLVRLLNAIEGGALDKAIIGALAGTAKDHPRAMALRQLSHSASKRVRGAVKARLHELLGVDPPARFDPWRQHCSTCQCGPDTVGRLERTGRRVNPECHPVKDVVTSSLQPLQEPA